MNFLRDGIAFNIGGIDGMLRITDQLNHSTDLLILSSSGIRAARNDFSICVG